MCPIMDWRPAGCSPASFPESAGIESCRLMLTWIKMDSWIKLNLPVLITADIKLHTNAHDGNELWKVK